MQIVVFSLANRRHGVSLSAVQRIVRAVEVTPLPKAPEIVAGIINVQGAVMPVIDMRRRFGLAEREIGLGDQIVVAQARRRAVALVVDAVSGVLECSEREIVAARDLVPDLAYVDGVVKLPDGLVLIHDLDAFLSLDEEAALDRALPRPA